MLFTTTISLHSGMAMVLSKLQECTTGTIADHDDLIRTVSRLPNVELSIGGTISSLGICDLQTMLKEEYSHIDGKQFFAHLEELKTEIIVDNNWASTLDQVAQRLFECIKRWREYKPEESCGMIAHDIFLKFLVEYGRIQQTRIEIAVNQ